MRVISVTWQDAMLSGSEWYLADHAAALKTTQVVTIGWELENSGEHIKIACSRCAEGEDNEQFSGIIVIPHACISDVTILKP